LKHGAKVSPPPPPKQEAVADKQPAAPDGLPYEPDFAGILRARGELGLSGAQAAALEKLRGAWTADAEPVVKEMARLEADMSKYLDAAEKQRLSTEDIGSRAEPYAQASAKYAKLRAEYQKQAVEVLDYKQRGEWEIIRSRTGGTK
jgi:hypothetical protein